MRIVGRARELALLESLLGAARSGRGRSIEISGEPGVGKTALIAELAARAEGWQVLTGRGTEFEADVPFGIFADALDDAVAALGPDRAKRLSGDRLGELAAMLPSIAAQGPPSTASATSSTTPRAPFSPAWPTRVRCCSCSTTSTGPTRPRSS